MRRTALRSLVTHVSIALALGLLLPAGARAGKIAALLITGDDVKSHPWKETSEVTRQMLVASGKFDVTVVEDLAPLEKRAELEKFAVILFMRYNTKKQAGDPSPEAKANLLDFVRGGRGFVVCHLASASFNWWDDWNAMCGRHWVFGKSGHGPRSVFKVKVADREHPIMKGIEDFDQDDELYAKLEGDVPIRVLARADSDWSGRTEPMLFTCEYGKGRVFHNACGHDGKACSTPALVKAMVRGCEWAATGKVTD